MQTGWYQGTMFWSDSVPKWGNGLYFAIIIIIE